MAATSDACATAIAVAPRRQTRYVWFPEGNVPAIEIDPSEVKRRLDAGEKIRMVDVREPFEHQQAHIAGAELIPMRAVPQSLESLRAGTAQLVLFCHHGMRSLQVAQWLRRQGFEDSVSMAGGIDRWSLEIDPTVPRYY
jgi:rhodanese-related sulfurtransferase